MNRFFWLLIFIPCISLAQKWNFEGIYTPPEVNYNKVRLKAWDTIRPAFTFTADSFKYSYAVMRPTIKVVVSVDYNEYGTWKIYKDTILSEPDKQTGKEFSFERIYATLDNGRITGYFEPAFAADSVVSAGNAAQLVFICNNKVFRYSQRPGGSLKRGE